MSDLPRRVISALLALIAVCVLLSTLAQLVLE